MCTVIYLPKKNGALFSSNRDENPNRSPALFPAVYNLNEQTKAIYAADGQQKGTWAGFNNAQNLLILLNGGFIKHEHKPPYSKSRGIIVKEMLAEKDPVAYWMQTNLTQIEPFTLIAYNNLEINQLVWTGSEKKQIQHSIHKPAIWSSATLYNSQVQEKRQSWFNEFLQNHKDPSEAELLQFLQTNNTQDDENHFVMNRQELVKTCSISILQIRNNMASYSFHDLLANAFASCSMLFSNHTIQ